MKKILFAIGFITVLILSINIVSAHCPLCTAAVGAGVATTRFYGVDDTLAGVWIGAFIVSTALWFDTFLKNRYKKRIPLQKEFLVVATLLLTIVPFYFWGLIGNSEYRLFGVDKLLLGALTGSLITYFSIFFSDKIRRKGKVLFPFQTIAIILIFLVLLSLVFQVLTG